MTQPDPDPTNREPQEVLSYVLDHAPGNRHWNPQLTAANCLRALESSGYQIVPKVELEAKENCVEVAGKLLGANAAGILHWKSGLWEELAAALHALDKENG